MADETKAIPTDAMSPDAGGTVSDGRGSDGHETHHSGVTNPAKLIRMGTMINQLLSEVRAAPPDVDGLRRLATIHTRTLAELSDVLSEELFDELMEFNSCCDQAEPPSEGEIRVAQAQLVGWLQGLLQGMQASAATQALVAQRQLAEMRQPGGPPGPVGGPPGAGGPAGYL
ncbi:MAG: DUF2587 domain-containing protein [Acidimicrobiales bacterium]